MEKVNFDKFVNGNWKLRVKIPDDKTKWGTFNILREKNRKLIRKICEDKNNGLIHEFYMLCIKELKNPKNSVKFVKELLSELNNGIIDTNSYLKFTAILDKCGIHTLIIVNGDEDSKMTGIKIPHIYQCNLGLPDKELYENIKLVKYYKKYILDLCKLYNITVKPDKLVSFEKKIMEKFLTRTQLRDSYLTYNKTKWKDIYHLGLKEYFKELISANGKDYSNLGVILTNVSLISHIDKIIKETDIETLRNYLIFKVLDNLSPILDRKSLELNFKFNSKITGQQKIKPLLKRALHITNLCLGDEIGKIYVKQHFSHRKKRDIKILVNKYISEFDKVIDKQDWMSNSTKISARKKLLSMGHKLGFPTKWHNIDNLWTSGLKNINLVKALIMYNIWNWKFNQHLKFYKPIDEQLWNMHPQEVNAYYSPQRNEIVIPAGILQKPFYQENDHIANLAGIGTVIGHEIIHGFDDEGRKYDENGELKTWWTDRDSKRYKSEILKLVRQYEQYKKGIRGSLTLGENIADIGGLRLSIRVMMELDIDDEEWKYFFERYANTFKSKTNLKYAKILSIIDPHPPSDLRINIPLMHVDMFNTVYNLGKNDKMFLNKEMRLKIW